ncbi:hypothetical protein [Thorsellia anophelis]|uniref:Uncharacterized protein n=1 Tax=Thorsellia anophelis DSM 18579 TaxID=1123402 RepID=A0A1I0B500_9GAMM|nr:hypothetical protein [Thorsellia anophelis]SET01814.1 hypothetical protein SAMN02583745_01145 [Thorsellia anophelis DSM 18579]
MKLKITFNKTLLAVAIPMLLTSTMAGAAVKTTQATQAIHGYQPLIPVVGVTGELKPGATVSIGDLYWYFDPDNGASGDTEIDQSKATIQWYILGKDETALPPYDPALPATDVNAPLETGPTFTIPRVDNAGQPIVYKNNDKVLAFRIIPTTQEGLPEIGKAIEVTNAIKLAGSITPPDLTLPGVPEGVLPPGVVPDSPDQPIDPVEPPENPQVTGPGGTQDPAAPGGPGDGTGIIYATTEYIVRIGLDENNDGHPDTDKLIYNELGKADEIFQAGYQPRDRAGELLLQADGKTPVTPIDLSTLTPGIPMVNTKYVVGIYEVEYDDTSGTPEWLVNYSGSLAAQNGTYVVNIDSLGPNLAPQFQKSITWQIDGQEVASNVLSITTQADNDAGKTSLGGGTYVSQQKLAITVSFDDDLTSEANTGTPAP